MGRQFTTVRLEQLANAISPILVTVEGIVILVIPLPVNAYVLIVVREDGKLTDVINVQYSKAFAPIEVTELGITIRLILQFENALSPIVWTPDGSVHISLRFDTAKAEALIVRSEEGRAICVRLFVFSNALDPIVTIVEGNAICVNCPQPKNALFDMVVRPEKALNSGNAVIVVFLNTVPNEFTASASDCDNSPS